jgi:hypothetical protein
VPHDLHNAATENHLGDTWGSNGCTTNGSVFWTVGVQLDNVLVESAAAVFMVFSSEDGGKTSLKKTLSLFINQNIAVQHTMQIRSVCFYGGILI